MRRTCIRLSPFFGRPYPTVLRERRRADGICGAGELYFLHRPSVQCTHRAFLRWNVSLESSLYSEAGKSILPPKPSASPVPLQRKMPTRQSCPRKRSSSQHCNTQRSWNKLFRLFCVSVAIQTLQWAPCANIVHQVSSVALANFEVRRSIFAFALSRRTVLYVSRAG